jgi:hypothetical protein
MNWFTNLDPAEIVSRDRSFRVVLRPGANADLAQIVDVGVASDTMVEMAKHGPVGLVVNSHVLNLANKVAWSGFGWWGDPIHELH